MERTGDGRFCAGAGVMAGLRLVEPFLQYRFVRDGLAASSLQTLGISPSRSITAATWAVSPFARFSVGGLNETATVVFGMMGLASIRHIYWALFTRSYQLSAAGGFGVGVYNGLINTINALVLVYSCSKSPLEAQSLGWKQYLGVALFAVGMGFELVPEETRRQFKQKPENKGKVDSTGAFGLIRHPNFFGYTLWRTGVALATGSIVNGIAHFAIQFCSFAFGSIPQLDEQMDSKYKGQWEEYKRRVPYALIPYVY